MYSGSKDYIHLTQEAIQNLFHRIHTKLFIFLINIFIFLALSEKKYLRIFLALYKRKLVPSSSVKKSSIYYPTV